MASKTGVLTDAKLKGLRPPESGQIEVSDASVPGLRVRLGASGTRTFIIRRRVGGRIRNIKVGTYNARFTLAEARVKARTILSDIEAGRDPTVALAKPERAAQGTIRAMLPAYLQAKAGKRTVGEVARIFKIYVLPELGDRMADAVTRAEVTALIDSVATGGARPTPVMARNVAAQLSAFYSWALPRLPRLEANPCRDAGKPEKRPARDRVLTERELAALWRVAGITPLPWGPGIRLLILTGQRREEVFQADRAEFGPDLWTIPAARAKNGKAHLVPLSREARSVLATVPEVEGSPKLFPTRTIAGRGERGPSGFSKAWAYILALVESELGGPVERFTMHDVRRTVATGLQRLGIRLEVTEAILNHVSGTRGGIAGVYQRHDFLVEKRAALDAWATELADRICRD